MALQLASAGARVKALIPILLGLTARSGKNSAAVEQAGHRDTAERFAVAAVAPIMRLSQEAKAALAPLDLPPDGPIDPGATLRARLAPDVAARNFVSWARALDLTGVLLQAQHLCALLRVFRGRRTPRVGQHPLPRRLGADRRHCQRTASQRQDAPLLAVDDRAGESDTGRRGNGHSHSAT